MEELRQNTVNELFSLLSLGTGKPGETFIFFSHNKVAAAAAKLLQLCLTLCNPIDRSPPGSPIPGILQAKEWVGISFSNA